MIALCFPLLDALQAGIALGALPEPVYVEEWSGCAGPGASPVDRVPLPVGAESQDSWLAEVVRRYNALSDEGLDYAVEQVEGGWRISPRGVPPVLDVVVDVPAGVPVHDAQRAVMLGLAERNVVVPTPPAPEGATPQPITQGALAEVPAWQAIEALWATPSAEPVGWSLRVHPRTDRLTADGSFSVFPMSR